MIGKVKFKLTARACGPECGAWQALIRMTKHHKPSNQPN
jgi:hypothetical protein